MKIEFHYDFGSPNSYFVHRVIPKIEERTGETFHYVPILLGGVFKATNNQPPMAAFGGVKGKLEYQRKEIQRFIRRHALSDFTFNPNFPINTVALMRGAIFSQDKPYGPDFVEAAFHHMWEAPKKMDDPEVLSAALSESGLPAEEILAGIQEQSTKQALIDSTAASVDRGNFGAPTVFVEDEMFFGKDTLWEVEEEITRLKA